MHPRRAAALFELPVALPVALTALTVAISACDTGSGPGDDASMTVSFAVQPRAGLAGMMAGRWTPALSHDATTLELTTVELEVDELVLERAELDGADSDGDSDEDSDSDGEGNEKFVVDGATVALPLGGGVITPFSEPVPEGLYEELEIDIEAIRLVGVVDGEAFDVAVPIDLELEMEFDPEIEVLDLDQPFNVTISIDPLLWLTNDDGSFIDPRELETDDSLRNLVRQRMALTFKAFEDSDHDGDDEDSDSDSDSG